LKSDSKTSCDKDKSNDKLNEQLVEKYNQIFWNSILNNLDTIGALNTFKSVVKDQKLLPHQKLELIYKFDKVLGLRVDHMEVYQLNEEQKDGVVAMLIEKCGVLINGYNKRGKKQDETHYRNLVERYSGKAEGSLK